MPNDDTPEKSTKQLAVWWRLIDLLEQLGGAWREARPVGTAVGESGVLPANVAVALVRSGADGAEAVAGVAGILAEQSDSGLTFAKLAAAARLVADDWPRRGQSPK